MGALLTITFIAAILPLLLLATAGANQRSLSVNRECWFNAQKVGHSVDEQPFREGLVYDLPANASPIFPRVRVMFAVTHLWVVVTGYLLTGGVVAAFGGFDRSITLGVLFGTFWFSGLVLLVRTLRTLNAMAMAMPSGKESKTVRHGMIHHWAGVVGFLVGGLFVGGFSLWPLANWWLFAAVSLVGVFVYRGLGWVVSFGPKLRYTASSPRKNVSHLEAV